VSDGQQFEVLRIEPGDGATAEAVHAVHDAAVHADDPENPPISARNFTRRLALAPPLSYPVEAWYAPDPAGPRAGTAIGWYRMKLPDAENTDRAELEIDVHPAWRRQGLGRRLLRHATGLATSRGREFLDFNVAASGPGVAFVQRLGGRLRLEDARRVLDLDAVPASIIAESRATAAKAAAGYSLVTWRGPTPAEHRQGVAEMFTTMNDAPNRPDSEREVWDEQRVIDQLDRRQQAMGGRTYLVAAVSDATGAMAALTEVRIDPDVPGWAMQGNTAVGRAHRGHRLGLLVKAAMIEWLAEAEPRARRYATWNAVVNKHMIAINEALGYAPSGPRYQEGDLRIADIPADF
jgi:GNAT superfamily N-acetyltransferase